MKIDEDTMGEFLESVGYDLFESEEGWRGKFEEKFAAWTKSEHEWIYGQQPDSPSMMERLMKDEEEGPSIARFVDTLDPADQKRAIEGMIGLWKLAHTPDEDEDEDEDDEDSEEMLARLKALL